MKKHLFRSLAAILVTVLFAGLGMASEPAGRRTKVDISGHPFKGPVNAPVTVVVFSDYL